MKTFKTTNLLIIALLFTTLFIACDSDDNILNCIKDKNETNETRTLDFENFDAFEMIGALDLEITEGIKFKVEAIGKASVIDELIEKSYVENETFYLGMNKCYTSKLNVKVTMPLLTKISIAGSSDVITNGVFNNIQNLELSVKGSGDLNLKLGDNMENINCNISGSSDFDLSGKAITNNIVIKGSGDIEAFDLETNSTTIKISGSADCEITANETLDVEITGSGDVCYKGSPIINNSITGSGDLSNCN